MLVELYVYHLEVMKNANDIHIWLGNAYGINHRKYSYDRHFNVYLLSYWLRWVLFLFFHSHQIVHDALHFHLKNIFNLMLLLPLCCTYLQSRWSQTHKYVRNCVIVFLPLSFKWFDSLSTRMTTRNTILPIQHRYFILFLLDCLQDKLNAKYGRFSIWHFHYFIKMIRFPFYFCLDDVHYRMERNQTMTIVNASFLGTN